MAKIADKGDIGGIAQLGFCYRNGIGTPMDIEKANYWFRMEKIKFHEIIRSNYELNIDNIVKTFINNDRYQLLWISYLLW